MRNLCPNSNEIFAINLQFSSFLKFKIAIYDRLEPEGHQPEEGKFHVLYTIGDIYFYNLRDYEQALAIYNHLLELSLKWALKEFAQELFFI